MLVVHVLLKPAQPLPRLMVQYSPSSCGNCVLDTTEKAGNEPATPQFAGGAAGDCARASATSSSVTTGSKRRGAMAKRGRDEKDASQSVDPLFRLQRAPALRAAPTTPARSQDASTTKEELVKDDSVAAARDPDAKGTVTQPRAQCGGCAVRCAATAVRGGRTGHAAAVRSLRALLG